MSQPETLSIPVHSFRKIETPYQRDYLDYIAVVDTSVLPDLSGWREINVRDPKPTSRVSEKIRGGFDDKPDLFVFMNRGLVLAVDKVTYDSEKSIVKVRLSDPQLHGLLDGGHTYNVVTTAEKDPGTPRYIRVEFLEGFSHQDITDVVDARNTSIQVQLQSLMNLAQKFKDLKDALASAPYANKVAYSEYAVDNEGALPIDVRDIVALLTMFDIEHFDAKTHPVIAYNSKAKCLEHFDQYASSYLKIYPLAQEILALYDYIRLKLPVLYNEVRRESGIVSGGKFGKLTGVTYYKADRGQYLYFLGEQTQYGIPDGLTYPILAAFRALVDEKGGRYVWCRGLKPQTLVDGEVGKQLAETIGSYALQVKDPSRIGKTSMVWKTCYQSVQLASLMATRK